ncbi:hypothetical protein PHMEG_00022412 [Phytophthora megakarya]|uniref:Uncharacterized protein n=1 Tax=Phytophthora megakarya TaxID=4795 RepID=A0A225VJ97_9STRA|nr:hypothetical protein PHMEG_00022412 [Phytophthora megakarya]
MADIEGKKPWRFVYRCLDIPFHFKRSEDPFDINFMRWDEFWRVHGRAVWERGFWQPLVPGSIESNRRKARQFRAMCAFRQFATELMKKRKKERGDDDEYLKTLSQTLHDGWWYRIEPFRLRNLWYKKRHLYDEYLETRVKLRWPCGKKFLAERGLKPIWWLPDYSPPTCQQ